jgi:nicotinate-nucleotide pyrophosphorylase (carboxylating)
MADLPLGTAEILWRALQEDVGRGDLTTDAVVPVAATARARIVTRAAGRIAGLDVAVEVFRLLDPRLEATVLVRDGEDAAAGAALAHLAGRARALLTGERVALNFLGRLSGIATATARAVAATVPHRARIADTRKTTPGLRRLEKRAVLLGGGVNHRFGLDDGILVKDNHIAAAGGVREAVARVRAASPHLHKVEVECDTAAEVDECLACGVDAILLDNMSAEDIAAMVRCVGGRALVEASGGITLERIPAIAATGVDLISLGWLTHSAPNLDVSLELAAPD